MCEKCFIFPSCIRHDGCTHKIYEMQYLRANFVLLNSKYLQGREFALGIATRGQTCLEPPVKRTVTSRDLLSNPMIKGL